MAVITPIKQTIIPQKAGVTIGSPKRTLLAKIEVNASQARLDRDLILNKLSLLKRQNTTIIKNTNRMQQDIFEVQKILGEIRSRVGGEGTIVDTDKEEITEDTPIDKSSSLFGNIFKLLGITTVLLALLRSGKLLKSIRGLIAGFFKRLGRSFTLFFGESFLGLIKRFGTFIFKKMGEFGVFILEKAKQFGGNVLTFMKTKLDDFILKPLRIFADDLVSFLFRQVKGLADNILGFFAAGLTKIPIIGKIAKFLGVGAEKVFSVGKTVVGKVAKFSTKTFETGKAVFGKAKALATGGFDFVKNFGTLTKKALAKINPFSAFKLLVDKQSPNIIKSIIGSISKVVGTSGKVIAKLGLGPLGILVGLGFSAKTIVDMINQGKSQREIALAVIPELSEFILGSVGAALGTGFIPVPFLGTLIGAIGGGVAGHFLGKKFAPQIADALGFSDETAIAKPRAPDAPPITKPTIAIPTDIIKRTPIPVTEATEISGPGAINETSKLTKQLSDISDSRDVARQMAEERKEASSPVVINQTIAPTSTQQLKSKPPAAIALTGDSGHAQNMWNLKYAGVEI